MNSDCTRKKHVTLLAILARNGNVGSPRVAVKRRKNAAHDASRE